MSSGMLLAALAAALGAGPVGYPSASPEYVEHSATMVPAAGPVESWEPGPVGSFGGGFPDELHPYDAPDAWQHGYFQEIPAYGGYGAFRPYNYKHVLAQSQAAGGWGMSPTMPYSQQFWHRYHDQAAMKEHLSRVGAAEYTAELARIRAQHDFAAQQRQAALSQQSPPASGALLRPGYGAQPNAVAPADYRQPDRSDRISELEHQLRIQAQQIEALRFELEQERRRHTYPAYSAPLR